SGCPNTGFARRVTGAALWHLSLSRRHKCDFTSTSTIFALERIAAHSFQLSRFCMVLHNTPRHGVIMEIPQKIPKKKLLFTISETAQMADVSQGLIRKEIRNRRLPAVRIGR